MLTTDTYIYALLAALLVNAEPHCPSHVALTVKYVVFASKRFFKNTMNILDFVANAAGRTLGLSSSGRKPKVGLGS